jgi:hypothetical protein
VLSTRPASRPLPRLCGSVALRLRLLRCAGRMEGAVARGQPRPAIATISSARGPRPVTCPSPVQTGSPAAADPPHTVPLTTDHAPRPPQHPPSAPSRATSRPPLSRPRPPPAPPAPLPTPRRRPPCATTPPRTTARCSAPGCCSTCSTERPAPGAGCPPQVNPSYNDSRPPCAPRVSPPPHNDTHSLSGFFRSLFRSGPSPHHPMWTYSRPTHLFLVSL